MTRPKPPLPDRLLLTLRAVSALTELGSPPTVAEIAANLQLSVAGAYLRLNQLEGAGLIERSEKHRSLRITLAGRRMLGKAARR